MKNIKFDTSEKSSINEAIKYFDNKNLSQAKIILIKILKTNPKNSFVLNFLGAIYDTENHSELAINYFDKAIEIKANYFEAWTNKAGTLFKIGKYDESIYYCNQATKINPDYPQAWYIKANNLFVIKNFDEAISCYNQAIKLKPNYFQAWFNKANALYEIKKFDYALDNYERAIEINSNYVEAWCNKGNVLHALKKFDEALSCYNKAIELKPNYAEAWFNKGSVFEKEKRYEEAMINYERAIQIKPDYSDAWLSKGNVFEELKLYDKALAHYDKAIKFKPNFAKAWLNKGYALHEIKKFDEALLCYDKSIELKPNYAEAWFNKSITKLLNGNFDEGLNLYEYRWKKNDFELYRYNRFVKLSSLENIYNKKILVWHEQGLGDVIQFSRFIPELVKLNADVTFEVQKDLVSFFQGKIQCVITSEINKESKFDYQIPLLSLPKLFNLKIESIPEPSNIIIDSEIINSRKKKLKLSNKRKNIGVAISGSPTNKNNSKRSIPLKYFKSLLKYGSFFLIQKEINQTDLDFINQNREITYVGDQIKNISDTASIVENMDLIISVDTSLIHIAGTLKKKSFLMLPWCPEWRWLLDRSDTPWYPTVKIFRQEFIENWDSVIKKIKNELV